MSTQSLMDRARQLMNPKAVGAALVIVPLAMAVPARADTVFTSDFTKISSISGGGGPMGHAVETVDSLDQHIVTLTGDTMPPLYPPNSFLLAQDLEPRGLEFTWAGGFASTPPLPPDLTGTILSIGYQLDSLGIPSDAIGTVSWTLEISVFSSADYNFDNLILDYNDAGNGPTTTNYPAPSPLDKSFDGVPMSWKAQLDVDWSGYKDTDSLSFSPTIVLSLDGEVGGNETPLPATFWTGSTMLALLGGFYIIRRRPKAAC